MTAATLVELLGRYLENRDAGWSIGSFGAIGEFHQRADDEVVVDRPDALCRATDKGGLRLDPAQVADAFPLAYETLSPRPERWGQGLALCLPEAAARCPRRDVLTELGPDTAAIRPQDRGGSLFDMGLDQPQIEFCIRTDDPELLAILREAAGRSLMDPSNPAMAAILAAHPHRVVRSALGRVEVYQKIGGPDTGGVSPDGPHTHVLPKLLRAGRTHSANIPVPAGFLPCASLHPPSPVMGHRGEDIPFDVGRFEAFEALLRRFGDTDYVAAKDALLQALDEGREEMVDDPGSRLTRTGLRNALRQQVRQAERLARPNMAFRLARLSARLDRVLAAEETDPDRPGHEAERA
ncbi:DUF6925 family protein [Stappia sp.]|uniref:DUF6925 family protein n=1 Tax=Stappia sp. TaxID=1870903 RepID=UPI0032D992F1